MIGEFTSGQSTGFDVVNDVKFRSVWDDCWNRARIECGAPNFHATALHLYAQLFGNLSVAPTLEEFTHETIIAASETGIFTSSLYEGAQHLVATLSEKGPLVVWTAGDVFGSTGSMGTKYPGSLEQVAKVSNSGVLGAVYTSRTHAVNIAAGEHKISLLPSIFQWLKERGVQETLVLDDKVSNLKAVERYAKETEPGRVHLVWVRQGRHGDTLDPTPTGMHSLAAISEIDELLGKLSVSDAMGTLLDYDGVVSNAEQLHANRAVALFRRFASLGWLGELRA